MMPTRLTRTLELLTEPVRLRILAVAVIAHGLAHLAGVVLAFDAAASGETQEYLFGVWDISVPARLRLIGVGWAVLAVAFLVVGWALWNRVRGWPEALRYTAAASLLATVLGLPAAVIGVAFNAALLAIALSHPRPDAETLS
jgi:hypothetical protein